MASKPVLHVEVEVKPSLDGFGQIDTIRAEVSSWLESLTHLQVGRKIEVLEGLSCKTGIVQIIAASVSPPQTDSVFVSLREVRLKVHVYEIDEILELPDFPACSKSEGEESIEDKLNISKLPNADLTRAWFSLHYDEPIQERLLHFATETLSLGLMASESGTVFDEANKLILLHGPPGSGKTSLSRALANRLAIRMSDHFSTAWLAEVNASSLYSKMFGESSKLVAKLFDRIQFLTADTATLVCVVIDEVEGLAGSRQRAISTNDIGDTLRATNQLLTAFDQLRHCPNIMVFCTTNLPDSIDAAFLDRVDVQQFMGQPSADGAYEILRSKLNTLIASGAVVYAQEVPPPWSSSDQSLDPETEASIRSSYAVFAGRSDRFPDVAQTRLSQLDSDASPPRKLYAIAGKCSSLSGRRLGRLPFLAYAEFTYTRPCPVEEVLCAVDRMVVEEARKEKTGLES